MNTLLTSKQAQVAGFVADGWSTPDIAAELRMSRRTVKAHIGAVYKRLGIRFSARDQQRLKLALLWNCELFQIGLKEFNRVSARSRSANLAMTPAGATFASRLLAG